MTLKTRFDLENDLETWNQYQKWIAHPRKHMKPYKTHDINYNKAIFMIQWRPYWISAHRLQGGVAMHDSENDQRDKNCLNRLDSPIDIEKKDLN